MKALSYNMSYASDLGINPDGTVKAFAHVPTKNSTHEYIFVPSELNFLYNYKQNHQDTWNPRLAWNNALSFLTANINTHKPCFVGLQEMNRWYNYSDQIQEFGKEGKLWKKERPEKGTMRTVCEMKLNNNEFGYTSSLTETSYAKKIREVWASLRGVEKVVEEISKIDGYDCFHEEVKGETFLNSGELAGRFSVVTIWHKPTLGEFHAAQVFPFSEDNSRPMLFVVVGDENNYTLLINLHSPNKPVISTENYTKLKDDINTKLTGFCDSIGIMINSFKNIFMVGDFNDRYGGLLTDESRGLFRTRKGNNDKIPGGEYNGEFGLNNGVVLKFVSDSAPISCCFNWDSTRGDKSKQELDGDVPEHTTIEERTKLKTNNLYNDGDGLNLNGDRGKDYYYLGDYCFSSIADGKLSVVAATEDHSDHKMVMLEIPATEEKKGGGRRYSVRALTRRISKKSRRKSRRHKRRTPTNKKQ